MNKELWEWGSIKGRRYLSLETDEQGLNLYAHEGGSGVYLPLTKAELSQIMDQLQAASLRAKFDNDGSTAACSNLLMAE